MALIRLRFFMERETCSVGHVLRWVANVGVANNFRTGIILSLSVFGKFSGCFCTGLGITTE